jgi:hypothetical protein
MNRKISWLIAVGDAVVLLIFAYGGEVTHELFYPGSLLLSVLHAALPFAVLWYPTAYLLGALSDSCILQPKDLLSRALCAWLIAAPLGIVLRGWLIGRDVIPTSFLLATYAFGMLFFIGWRTILYALAKFGVVRAARGT